MKALSIKSVFLYLLFLFSVLGFFSFHTDSSQWSKLILESTVVLTILLLFWKRDKTNDEEYWLLRGFGILFLVTLIPALIQADSTLEGLSFFSKYGFILVCCVALSAILGNDENRIQNSAKMMTFLLFVISGWAMFEWVVALDGTTLTHQATYKVTANMAHRNLLVQYMLVLLPFVAIYEPPHVIWKVVKACSIGFALLLGILLLNRMAWITLVIFSLVTAFVQMKFNLFPRLVWRKVMQFGITSVVIILIFGLLVIDDPYTFWHQFEMSFDLEKGTTRDRLLLQARTLELAFSSLFFGAGFDSWKVLIMQYPQDGMLTESGTLFYQRPHNDYLWLFSEAGILPALLYLGVHVWGIVLSFRRIRPEGFSAYALHLSWIGIFIASFTNFPVERPEFLLIISLLCVLTFRSPRVSRFGKLSQATIVLISIMVVLTFVWRGMAEWHYFEARSHQTKDEWSQAKSSVDKAISLGMVKDSYSMPLEWFSGFYLQGNGTSCNSFQKAYVINPYHPDVLNSLGICSVNERKLNDGMTFFYESVNRTPRYLQGWFNVAQIRYQQGDWRSAFKAYLNADPSNSNEAFEQLGVNLAIDSLNHMLPSFPERKMYLTVEAIRNTPHWALDLMKKSSINHIPFSDQVLIDASYYMLNTCEEYDDCDLANSLIEKYLPAGLTDLEEMTKTQN